MRQDHGKNVELFIREALNANPRLSGRFLADRLNREGIQTRWHREWTIKALFRWMQRRQLRLIDIRPTGIFRYLKKGGNLAVILLRR